VHKDYCKAAKDLDSKYHHNLDDELGPVKSVLLSLWLVAGKHEGMVLELDLGCFGELSAGFNDVCTFIARNRAVSCVGRYDDESPKEALCMFRSRIRRVWGHAAIFCLERPHLGPQPHAAPCARVATPNLTSRTTPSSKKSPQAPDAVFTPVRGERTGMSTSNRNVDVSVSQALVSRVRCEVTILCVFPEHPSRAKPHDALWADNPPI